jgi:ubiquinone/menaquinone biosynthesis C-methylase UbiE
VGYFDWHEQPGYFRDVTRHFPADAKLLDIGCGTGWIAEHFADYSGIDGSPDAVEQAQKLGRNVQLGDVDQRLPFEDNTFDAVVMKDLLEHVVDPAAVVTEAKRVLKNGGLAFASSPDAQRWVWDDYTHRRAFSRRGFRRLFADQGFEVLKVSYESVMPGTSIVSARTRRKRRPRTLVLLSNLRFVRRNVWILARA